MTKMILGIDTTDREKIYLALYDDKKERCFEFKTQDQSKDILLIIDSVLKKEKISLKNIAAILVNIGPGSYTGTRIGVTVANTLAWTLNIPVLGDNKKNFPRALAKLKHLQNPGFSNIVSPKYPLAFRKK